MPADAERDPIEWAQHSALVAISVARTVLDLVEALVADRERLEHLASSGRSIAESVFGDAMRVAATMASGFGFEPPAPAAAPAEPSPPPAAPTTVAAAPASAKRQATKQAKRPAAAKKRTAVGSPRTRSSKPTGARKKAASRPAKKRA